MKKTVSWILALIMLVSCCSLWVTSISAADSGDILGSWSFDEESLAGKTDEKLLDALGWGYVGQSYPSSLKASVTKDGLRLQNTNNSRVDLLIACDEMLKEGFTLEYDFRYANSTNLPATVGSVTRYNSAADAALMVMGGNTASDAATWHVQPRINGNFLNSPKTDGNAWVDVTKMTPNYDNDPIAKWFTVRIVFSPDTGVHAMIKAQGSDTWLRSDSYSDETLATAKSSSSQFVSEYLRFMVSRFVDVFVDNITISLPSRPPQFVGYQYGKISGDTYSIRLIGCIEDMEGLAVGCKIKTTTYDEATGIRREITQNLKTTRVYQTMSYEEGGSKVTVRAEDLCAGMKYLFAIEIENLSRGKNNFYEIIPYIESEEGIEYGGAMYFGYAELTRELPDYDTASGTVGTPVSFSINNAFTIQVEGSTRAEMDAYVSKLQGLGYTLYQTRDNVNENYFRTLYNNTRMIHVYFMPAANTGGDFSRDVVRIVTETTPLSQAFPTAPYGDAKVTDGSMTFMNVDGLGVVFTNPDGSYVIADGGWGKCAADVYNFLKNNNKRTDGKILIRAWILTHAHEDHWGSFIEFSKNYASAVKVEYVVTQLNQQYCNRNAQVYDGSRLIREAATKFSGAKVITPHTGQVMYFGELETEFLYTFETLLSPKTVTKYLTAQVDGNEASLTFRGKFATGQTAFVTGDIQTNACAHMDAMYKTHLKSDIVTTPHHGVERTTTDFYPNHVRPKVVLVPANEEFMTDLLVSHANQVGTAAQAISYAKSSGGSYYSCSSAGSAHRTFKLQ